MAIRETPTVLVFDVDPVEPLLLRLFGDAAILREGFARLVLHSRSVTLAGHCLAFGALGADVLLAPERLRGAGFRPVTLTDPATDRPCGPRPSAWWQRPMPGTRRARGASAWPAPRPVDAVRPVPGLPFPTAWRPRWRASRPR